MTPNSPARGFTLIELLVVVAIVAILAMIAYPSYQDQLRKARRADAQAVLMEGAQFMERVYSENGRYDQTVDGTAIADIFPFTKSPIDGSETYYAIGVQAVAPTSYTLQATPQAGSSQAGTGLLQVNNLGQKAWDENADGDVTDAGESDWDRG